MTLNERAAIRLSDACVATSVTTAARLRREEGAARVEVARPGADRLPLRPRRPARDGRLRLVSVAAWIPRKRLLELLGAFERASAGAELHLIGDPGRDPSYAAQVRAAIAGSAFLRGRVAARGVVGDEALADALAEADALVAASSLEGYGMALAEAIRAGVPVISTRGGAVAEVVQDGAEALLCDGPGDLAAALARFLDDAALRRRMRAAAEARAPALPTWDEAAAALRAAAGRFVGGRPAL
jgi:glycosyltransferase involved in cell wall biosynthesis